MSKAYKVYFDLTIQDVPAVEAVMDELFETHSLVEIDEDKAIWRAEIFSETPLNADEILKLLPKSAVTGRGFVLKTAETEDVNWLEKSFENFPPLRIGKFYLYGTHITDKPPEGSLAIKLNAATAFGSGEHFTTNGCIRAMLDLEEQGFAPKSILDMGCGSGVLAMAAAKLWPDLNGIMAVDNDPEAVTVTKYNLAENELEGQVSAFCGDGYKCAEVQKAEGFDLILSNILAKPLCFMAKDACAKLNRGGYIILAGLLVDQKQEVLQAYLDQGLTLIVDPTYENWQVLVLKK